MQLLTAINDLLRAAGESKIEALDGDHPLQEELEEILLRITQREQNQGWWFNQYYAVLPADAGTGVVAVPAGTVKVIPKEWNDRNLILKGLELFDKTDRSTNIGRSVPALLTEQWDFIDLPESFAEYVVAMASIVVAETYNADPLKLQSLGNQLALAKQEMHKEHVQLSKVNMLETASMGNKLVPGWGARYASGMSR